jgi:hypothetical protein
MPREKVNIKQHQFGFPDEDLKTSLHDEIVLWLKSEKLELAKTLTDWSGVWDAEWIDKQIALRTRQIEERKIKVREALRSSGNGSEKGLLFEAELKAFESWSGLGDPGHPEIRVESEMEVPIKRERYKSYDIIGYADLVLSVQKTYLEFEGFPCGDYGAAAPIYGKLESYLSWPKQWIKPQKIAFDAKSSIASLGELIRQFRTYEQYCSWPFFIVSPDKRFAEQIGDEGFGFIHYPEGKIVYPKRRSSNS